MAALRFVVCVGPRCDAAGRGRARLATLRAALDAAMVGWEAEGRIAVTTRDCLRLCTSDPVIRLEPSGDAVAGADIAALVEMAHEALGGARDERRR